MSARKATAVLVGCGLLGLAPLAARAAERVRGEDSDAAQARPPQACEDKITAGGWITGTPTGARANYGASGGIHNGAFWGHLNYLDHSTSPPMHVRSHDITSYAAVDEFTRRIEGNCDVDGVDATFILVLGDHGEPGREDTFCLKLSTGYQTVPTPGVPGNLTIVEGGNVQIHDPCLPPGASACGGIDF